MKVLSAALLVFFMSLTSFTEVLEEKEEKIQWDENRKLTWSDFKGTPNGSTDFVASTNSGVGFSFSYKERNGVGKVTVVISTNFYPALSWYRPERVNTYILGHEQLHFDISELHARKFRKALVGIPHDRNYKEKAEKIYNEMEAKRRAMQTQYDSDSDHSNVRSEEYRWRRFVSEELEAYSQWK